MKKRKFLKPEEVKQIELFAKDQKLIDKEIVIKKLELENLKVQIEKKNLEIEKLMYKKDLERQKLKNYYIHLKKICRIKNENWGFDPETGEIMEG